MRIAHDLKRKNDLETEATDIRLQSAYLRERLDRSSPPDQPRSTLDIFKNQKVATANRIALNISKKVNNVEVDKATAMRLERNRRLSERRRRNKQYMEDLEADILGIKSENEKLQKQLHDIYEEHSKF
jgi:hypothetical protein